MTEIDRNNGAYPPIGSLGAIGDGRSMALIGADGNFEWFCPGRFDAPPLIWPLLDRRRGGRLRIGPAADAQTAMRYLDESAVLESEWRTVSGHAQARLCMQWPPCEGQQRLLWELRGISGHVDVEIDFAPRFDFGRSEVRWRCAEYEIELEAGDTHLRLQGDCPLRPEADGMRGRLRLEANQVACFVLSAGLRAGRYPSRHPIEAVPGRIEATLGAWRAWTAGVYWIGPYRESILRSAITLKLLIYEPTGAVVAAGTTSLPEGIGGVRNWDYRYTWFRDAGLTLSALFALGCRHEAHRWAEWMQEAVMRYGTPLRVLYGVDGEIAPPEDAFSEPEGYRGSRPVRTGNAAEGQFQLDLYGELLECVFICDTMNDDALRSHWPHLRAAADFIAQHWHEPGSGIWEVRSAPRHFVHSKVAAWAGLQRALWFEHRHGLAGATDVWERAAAALREDILRRGVSRDGRRFVRSYGEEAADANLLLLTRGGFVDGQDVRFRNTVDAVRRELDAGGIDGLLLRYRPDGIDGLPGEEGAFAICSFWLVEALAVSGRKSEAQALFEQLLARQGDLGLYAEQFDPASGEHLGNFPQAFTHIGVINAARALAAQGRE